MDYSSDIRSEFDKELEKLASKEGIQLLPNLTPESLSGLLNLASWKDTSCNRMMGVQEEEEGSISFDSFIKKVGVIDEIDHLCVMAVNPHKHVDKIFALYKDWFVEKKTCSAMEEILDAANQE